MFPTNNSIRKQWRRRSSKKEEKMATHTMVTGKKRRRTVNNLKEEKLRRPWSDLPQELLELIKKRILFPDQKNFPAVCKSWSSIGSFPPAKQIPWLIVFDETDANTWSSCKLVDPMSKKTYIIDMKAIKEKNMIKDFNTMKVHESKYGWLLISSQHNQYPHSKTSLFLFSPFYKEKNNVIELPVLKYSNISFATFTSNPLKEDCKFWTITPQFKTNEAHSKTEEVIVISTYSRGDKTWCSWKYSSNDPLFSLAEVECWTFSEGIFYWASRKAVGKLDLNRMQWIRYLLKPPITYGGNLHIVKSDGEEELFLILERSLRTSDKMLCHFVACFSRFDISLSIWETVVRSGDRRVLFIGDGYNCVSRIDGKHPKGISNRLYYCSGSELKFCRVDGIEHRRSYNCCGHYGLIATKDCRKLLIDPPSLPLH